MARQHGLHGGPCGVQLKCRRGCVCIPIHKHIRTPHTRLTDFSTHTVAPCPHRSGSNDDWYWLYASVAARSNGLLVSNDEMRDHIWNLLRPKHFLKWKDRHVARCVLGVYGLS